jgi:polysaccharide biosynthesis protein PelB
MLPDRSKRYAGVDGEIARLHLAANWQLVLVALLVLALLAAVFPRKALIEKLYQQQSLDDLTLSYVQNLYRTNPNNPDATLLLAKTRPDLIDVPTLESVISDLLESNDVRQRNEARTILLKAYRSRLDKPIDKTEEIRISAQLVRLLHSAQQDDLPVSLVRRFAEEAFKLDQPDLGVALFKRLNIDVSADELAHFGDLALGRGQHSLAAKYYFMARDKAESVPDARRYFQAGVKTLMAASQYAQAMETAKIKIGDLANDQQTLRFMLRTALAAGDPMAAAGYARKLVFQ